MIKLKIDKKDIMVREGIKLIDAAREHGINIPSLCYKKEIPHYTSCMLCMVKDIESNKFIPSCSARVEEGMNIDTSGPEVISLRQEAISLLLTEHRAECEAPCKLVCPVGLNIPLVNRYVQNGEFSSASQLIYREMGIPETLCSICPKYCEKACRRKMIDTHIAITSVKRFVTESIWTELKAGQAGNPAKIAIIGAGASGLSIAFNLAKYGHSCEVFERSNRIGGTILTELSDKGLSYDLFENEGRNFTNSGIDIRLNTTVDSKILEEDLIPGYDAVINASAGIVDSDKSKIADFVIQFEDDTRILNGKYLFKVGSIAKQDKQVIRRISAAKKSAEIINKFLQSGNLVNIEKRFNSIIGKIEEDEKKEWIKECPEEISRFTNPDSKEECIGEAFNCMHCDCRAIDDCSLRIMAEELYVRNPKLKLINHPIEKKINKSNNLIFENSKCIKCGLCVRLSTDETDNPSLCFTGRGYLSLISEPLTHDFDSVLMTGVEEVIKECPTGALAKKDEI